MRTAAPKGGRLGQRADWAHSQCTASPSVAQRVTHLPVPSRVTAVDHLDAHDRPALILTQPYQLGGADLADIAGLARRVRLSGPGWYGSSGTACVEIWDRGVWKQIRGEGRSPQ